MYKEIVKLLLNTVDIYINAKNINNQTALHIACENSDTEIVEILLKTKEIDITLTDKNSKTPLNLLQEHPDINLNDPKIIQIIKKFNELNNNVPYQHQDSSASMGDEMFDEINKMDLKTPLGENEYNG